MMVPYYSATFTTIGLTRWHFQGPPLYSQCTGDYGIRIFENNLGFFLNPTVLPIIYYMKDKPYSYKAS